MNVAFFIRRLLFLVPLWIPPTLFAGGIVSNCTEADLRAALSGGGTVTFDCDGTILLSTSLVVNVATVLDGSGRDVTLSGQGTTRLFVVQSGTALELHGLKLIDGLARGDDGGDGTPTLPGQPGRGGCILNLGGQVAVEDCLFSGHLAQGGNGGTSGRNTARGGGGYGGAIYSQGGQVMVGHCVFSENGTVGGEGSQDPGCQNNNGDSGEAVGGALYSEGADLRVTDSTFLNNTSVGGAPEYGCLDSYSRGGDAAGGAVGATNCTFRIENSLMATNSTLTLISPWSGRGTGAAQGGALFLNTGVAAEVVNCRFFANSCGSGGAVRFAQVGTANGGAIFNAGVLSVADSTLTSNQTKAGRSRSGAQGDGGAITSTGNLTVTGSTFDHNTAVGSSGIESSGLSRQGFKSAGGAIWSGSTLQVTNSTFAANVAQGGDAQSVPGSPAPGGVGSGGALHIESGAAVLVNLTIVNNQALGGWSDTPQVPPQTDGQGAGLSAAAGSSVLIQNSILASNAPNGNVAGSVTDGGYNLSSDGTPTWTTPDSHNDTDPLLGPLSDNGGPTPTMALLTGSPALDVIPSGAPPTDQRGVSRPQGPASDIGAYEASGPMLRVSMVDWNVIISFKAEAGHTYELLRSNNFAAWEHLDSQKAESAQPMHFTQPVSMNVGYVYRISSD